MVFHIIFYPSRKLDIFDSFKMAGLQFTLLDTFWTVNDVTEGSPMEDYCGLPRKVA